MKNFVHFTFIISLLLVFSGCSKDNDEQTLMINTFYQYPTSPHLGKTIASPSLVVIYDYSTAAKFDKDQSRQSLKKLYRITLPDRSTPAPLYSSFPNTSGIYTFDNVKNGRYMIFVYFSPDGEWIDYYGYKEISVNSKNSNSYDLILNREGKYRYQFIAL